jgi:hypothetical protein
MANNQYEEYRQKYLEELLPEGHTEQELCEQYIFANWQIDRVREVELKQRFEANIELFGSMAAMGRYRAGLERSRDRTYKQFREIQNERYQRNAPYEAPTNHLPPFVRSAALRRTRMEYAFDNQVDPHIPEVWPYTSFARSLPPPALNTSTVDYPPKTVYERERPFPHPPIHVLERELKQQERDERERQQAEDEAA